GDQHVAAERELALLSAWTVGNDLALDNAIALTHDRLLVDAGVLVRALELDELVDVGTNFARQLCRVMLTLDAHDDAFRVDRVNDAITLGQNDGAGIARGHAFHAGTDKWSFGDEQWNRLALHVGAHQRA